MKKRAEQRKTERGVNETERGAKKKTSCGIIFPLFYLTNILDFR